MAVIAESGISILNPDREKCFANQLQDVNSISKETNRVGGNAVSTGEQSLGVLKLESLRSWTGRNELYISSTA